MLIGYARVSTEDQNLDLQRDALTMFAETVAVAIDSARTLARLESRL